MTEFDQHIPNGHGENSTPLHESAMTSLSPASERKWRSEPLRDFHVKEPGKKSAFLLAGLMHVLLVLFLWIGIRWQNQTAVGVEAEIWDMQTRAAAPLPMISTSLPAKIRKNTPEPGERLEQEQEREAEIALERTREKKRKIEAKRLEEKKAKLAEEKDQQKRNEEVQKKEKKKQELARQAEQKKMDALIQQQRNENLKRLASQISGSGDAVKSTGNNRVDPGYAGKIAAKIKSNMVYVGADNGPNNPTVDFVITLFPDGSLRGAPRKIKSSGVPAFDDAVDRAITKSAPYPPDKSGKVPVTIPLTYRLKD